MTDKISSPTRTKEIIDKYNFYFKKGYGQNFLIDSNILEKISEAADINKEDCIIEIGPGIGSLTQVLAEKAGNVVAVEIDKNLIPILNDILGDYKNIEFINNDILKIDLNALIDEKSNGKKIKIVANLPYYITTPIIMGILEKKVNVKTITVMVQKEVAERMTAVHNSKDYGALSVAVQYYCDTEINMIVNPSCFMPKPKVASAVITLTVLNKPKVDVISEKLFFDIVKLAFGQRRKTLSNSLYNQGRFGLLKEDIILSIKEAGLSEKIRGEAVSIQEFGLLSDIIYKKINA